jgi:hypothetical protein
VIPPLLLLLPAPLPLPLRDPPLCCSPDEPIPRSLELEPGRLSDGLPSENIARSLLVPRSCDPDDDSRLRMRWLLDALPLELL